MLSREYNVSYDKRMDNLMLVDVIAVIVMFISIFSMSLGNQSV